MVNLKIKNRFDVKNNSVALHNTRVTPDGSRR